MANELVYSEHNGGGWSGGFWEETIAGAVAKFHENCTFSKEKKPKAQDVR